MADVATLLATSRARHTDFHVHQQANRPADARVAMLVAQQARLDAEAADPAHTDGAWAQDKAPSADILNFFRLYLAKTA